MESDNEMYKVALNKILNEQGLFQVNYAEGNIYKLVRNNDPDHVITAQFVVSEPGNESTFGIRGIQAIGNFRFKTTPPGVSEPDFYIFAFMNLSNSRMEFIIIPCIELKKRIKYRNRTISNDQEAEFVFWLMEERTLYDTTGLGAEGFWWYIDGRMASDSYMNYTFYLNFWEILTTI